LSDLGRVQISRWGKAALGLEICATYVNVCADMHRKPLSELVDRLARSGRGLHSRRAGQLSCAVDRTLRLSGRRPTCLVRALILFRLLRRRGEPAALVVGLPEHPVGPTAHAWVELGEVDVGPPPGQNGHVEMARFG
jgi:transglutaminase superfamily protein